MEGPESTDSIGLRLASLADEARARAVTRYFRAYPGGYGEGDVFLGISMPELRQLAKDLDRAGMESVTGLLRSRVHEERMLALLMLMRRYEKGGPELKAGIFDRYIAHTRYINNWDLVDVSAPRVVGDYLLHRDKALIYDLARSESLWERRIAVLSTLAFIRQGVFDHTLALARFLLHDREDLMHKAVGWMLREVGKRDEGSLRAFLDAHGPDMPRTMLRYAMEKLPPGVRAGYLGRRGQKGIPARQGAGHG